MELVFVTICGYLLGTLGLCCVEASEWTCPQVNWNMIFTRVNGQPSLPFMANISSTTTYTNFSLLTYEDTVLMRIDYVNGNVVESPVLNGCQLIGDPDTGDLTVRLDHVTEDSAGVYRFIMSSTDTTAVERCMTLYILGTPMRPIIKVLDVPTLGDTARLQCSSLSTTIPNNHTRNLFYNWWVDGVINPTGTKLSYSLNKETLTVNNVTKTDADTQFVCSASEDVSGGYTSLDSEPVSVDVIYGPDDIRFEPPIQTIKATNGTSFMNFTCIADCFPLCDFGWAKISPTHQTVSDTAILYIGLVTEEIAGTYRCIAHREGGLSESKTLIVQVIYKPVTPVWFRHIPLSNMNPVFVWETAVGTMDTQYFSVDVWKNNATEPDRSVVVDGNKTQHTLSENLFFVEVDSILDGKYTAKLSSLNENFDEDFSPLTVGFNIGHINIPEDDCDDQSTKLIAVSCAYAITVFIFVMALVIGFRNRIKTIASET